MKKFQNNRIPSARLQNWDYGRNAAYFVTICTQNRKCYFGNIIQDEMQLSHIGILADVLWYEIKHHFPNVKLNEFMVMPNHIHGVLILNNNNKEITTATTNDSPAPVETRHALSDEEPRRAVVDKEPRHAVVDEKERGAVIDEKERHALSLRQSPPSSQTIGKKRFQNQGSNTLSSIVGAYKSAVTRHARRLGYSFAWQPRFYDHIIRDEKSYLTIRNYVIYNPKTWKDDELYV